MAGLVAKLIDVSKCTACRSCQVSCKQWNDLSTERTPEQTPFAGSYQSHQDLGPNTFTIIKYVEKREGNKMMWHFRKHGCKHCGDSACIKACPKGALSKLDNGIVSRDWDKCIGCGYCVEYCTFSVMKLNPQTEKSTKCTFCEERVAAKLKPACVSSCITGCLEFGAREEIIAKAEKRVAELKKRGVTKAQVYGLHEAGGLNVIYVLEDDPSVYGLVKDIQVPAEVGIWKNVAKPAGLAILGASLITTAVAFVSSRKAMVKETKHQEGGKSHGA